MNPTNTIHTEKTFELKIPKSNAFLLIPKSKIGTIAETATIRQAVEKMRYHGYTSIPVLTESGMYYGTVNEGDFLWYFMEKNSTDLHRVEDESLSTIVRPSWNPPVGLDVSLEVVLKRVLDQNFIPVVDDRNMFMGIITRKSVLQFYYDTMHEGC